LRITCRRFVFEIFLLIYICIKGKWQADEITLRTDPLIRTACLIQCYTQHVLKPHIDKDSEHQIYFLKIHFINKGIYFIDLQSILRDKHVIDSIPKYFKNSEAPIICYKHCTPIRNLVVNYNKIVADLNINDNMPDTWDCATSKFCYTPAVHVITSNFDTINDKRLRYLLNKGPKYRIPFLIDFNSCRGQIAEALQDFGIRCCRRESNALTDWKKNKFLILLTNTLRFIT